MSQLFPFRIRVVDGRERIASGVTITVFDGWDEVRGEGAGSVDLSLPAGLYSVRVERFGRLEEHVVRHADVTDRDLPMPLHESAAPLRDTATTAEPYEEASRRWSVEDTRAPILNPAAEGAPRGRLFVLLRAASPERADRTDLARDLLLSDSMGGIVTSFHAADVESSDEGWLALSAAADPGVYYLRQQGRDGREMAIHVHEGFATQVFISRGSRSSSRAGGEPGGLRFDAAVVLMPRLDKGFDPDDRIARAVDVALAGLDAGRAEMPEDVLAELLDGKFDDPMLGLLGAHRLLLRPDRGGGVLETVLGNLDKLIPGSPDVRALRLLAGERRGAGTEATEEAGPDPPQLPFTAPPMLRAGLEAVLRASARHPELVPEGSLLEAAAPRLLIDSPWSSWEPVIEIRTDDLESTQDPGAPLAIEFTPAAELGGPDWVTVFLSDVLSEPEPAEETIDTAQLAAQTGLPYKVIERYLTTLEPKLESAAAEDDFTELYGVGPRIEGAFKDLGYRTFEDLARVDVGDLKRIEKKLGRFAGRMEKWDWVGQARLRTRR